MGQWCVLLVLSACTSLAVASNSECLQWSTTSTWQPGRQGATPLGVCRVVSMDTVPMGVEVGKLEGTNCFFTGNAPGMSNNGTATSGYQVAAIAPECQVGWAAAGSQSPAVVAGFRSSGENLGVCLALGGEGSNSSIVGKLFLDGPRKGQCCWSANYAEHCKETGYSYCTYSIPPTPAPTPAPPPPPVPPEPIPPPLEPNAMINSLRLSYGANSSVMGVTFSTPNNTNASYTPMVEWYTNGGARERAPCLSSAPRTCYTVSPVMHYCNMTGLSGGSTYSYQVGDPQVGMTSPVEFRAAPVAGQSLSQVVVVYGDMGLDYSEHSRVMLAEWAQQSQFDWVIHNGDISYADNRISVRGGTMYNDWMDIFYANVSRYAASHPYMLAPGNHEVPCNYAEYEARAQMMPYRASGSQDVQYYSYTVGRIHVVALSGEAGRLTSAKDAQVQWLEHDLARASGARARGELDWIITHVHYPNIPTGYCSSKMSYCCADGNVGLRSEIEGTEGYASTGTGCVDSFMTEFNKYVEDVFVKHHVDFHITAHQHVYERTTPVYRYAAYGNGTERLPANHSGDVFVAPHYPINLNNGCPGNVELQDSWMPRPEWSVGARLNSDGSGGAPKTSWRDFGVLKLSTNVIERSMTVEYVSSADQAILDRFVVYK